MGPPSTVTCGSSDETIMDYQVCDFKRGMLSVIRLVTVSKTKFSKLLFIRLFERMGRVQLRSLHF